MGAFWAPADEQDPVFVFEEDTGTNPHAREAGQFPECQVLRSFASALPASLWGTSRPSAACRGGPASVRLSTLTYSLSGAIRAEKGLENDIILTVTVQAWPGC